MALFPEYRPHTLSLGPLETEILELLWQLEPTTAVAIHEKILEDLDRELTYSSVSTVLRRLQSKGWLVCKRVGRSLVWQTQISRQHAELLVAHRQLHQFLKVSNPDIVAAFADTVDEASLEQLETITQRIRAARQQREARE
jgi:predicted transcriptional regulator